MDYKLEVLMMAYNHGKFIRQAIDSILAQETDFPFRIIIGEDFSTDDTREICKEYKERFPDKIHLVTRDRNVGPYVNFVEIYNCSQAPYIAMCEGDDYWTDSTKLRKQLDFLDANEDFILCFHAVKELRSDGSTQVSNKNQAQVTDVTNLIQGWYMNTASYVFRNTKKIDFPKWFYQVKATDLCFHILIAEDGGKIYFMEEVMAVYRRHEGGVTDDSMDFVYHLKKNIPFYQKMITYFKSKNSMYTPIAEARLRDIKTRLFYQIYYKKNKKLDDYVSLLLLGIQVKWFQLSKRSEE